jgi:hypothetical protein
MSFIYLVRYTDLALHSEPVAKLRCSGVIVPHTMLLQHRVDARGTCLLCSTYQDLYVAVVHEIRKDRHKILS